MADAFTYLEKREAQLQYPGFQAAGWPIGRGSVESGNKLVVEARLKGSGMHWARSHVDPMVTLRNVMCNDRRDEGWAQIVHTQRQQATMTRIARRQKRHAARTAAAVTAEPPPVSPPPETECPKIETPEPVAAVSVPTARPWSRCPAANHP